MKTKRQLSQALQGFKDWCEQQGRFEGYADNIGRWAYNSTEKVAFLIDNLPSVFSYFNSNKSSINIIKSILITVALNEKYTYYKESHYKESQKSKKTDSKSEAARKKGNTADNLIAHLHSYFLYVENNVCVNGQLSHYQLQIVNNSIDLYIKSTHKNQQKFRTKIKSALKTQNRVYTTFGNPWFIFPVTLIVKIIGKQKTKKWIDNIVLPKIDILTDKGILKIDVIKSVEIIPWKRVTIKTNDGVKAKLMSRKDTNSCPNTLKAAKFDDISIGHMTPISETLQKMVNSQKIPTLVDLSDKIYRYFIKYKIELNQNSLKKEINKIYKEYEEQWTDSYKEDLYNEILLIENKEKYELQDRADNIKMGGINRKK